MSTESDALKLETLATMLNLGVVVVWVDGRACSGLPAHVRANPTVGLRIGYGLSPEIPDLQLGALGWSATLSFQGTDYKVDVPWSAVYVLSGEGAPEMSVSWPGSAPRAEYKVPKPRPEGGLKLVD